MKTSILKSNSWLMTVGFLLISLNINSQDNKISRQDQKAAKRDKQYFNFQVVDSMLENKSFVLEADFLQNQYGDRVPVLSGVNFIMIDFTNVVLQTGSTAIRGSNGVGGVTAEGRLENLKITKDFKNLTFSVRFTATTQIGIYDIFMTINSNRYARATISGLTRGKLIYDGRILALYDSGVYKGRNSIY